MELLPQEIREKLPPLQPNDGLGVKAIAHVKFFHTLSNWTWYASEFDGKDVFFGFVIGDFPELGYFALSELKTLLPFIALDEHYKPKTLEEIRAFHVENGYAY